MKLLIVGISDKCSELKRVLQDEFDEIDIIGDFAYAKPDEYDYVLVASSLVSTDPYPRLRKPSGYNDYN